MINIIYPNEFPFKRQPYDEFYYDLLLDLEAKYPYLTFYYMWTWNSSLNTLSQQKFTDKIVVFFLTDGMQINEFRYWEKQPCEFTKVVIEIAKYNPQTFFILLSSTEYIEREISNIDNLLTISTGCCLIQTDDYKQCDPVIEKNLKTNKVYISLNRNLRFSRGTLVSYLLGSDLGQHGHISFDVGKISNYATWLDWCPWPLTYCKEEILKGFQLLKQGQYIANTLDQGNLLFDKKFNDNAGNFKHNLTSLYHNSFVEIISETTCSEPSVMITEKTINSIYGCNFPIMINGLGAVKHLKSIGIDVFEDIVDHSYDSIEDPVLRIISAINSNRHLLSNLSNTKTYWIESKKRFLNNVNWVNNSLAEYYQNKVLTEFSSIIDKIGLDFDKKR